MGCWVNVMFYRSVISRWLTALCVPFISLLMFKFTYPITPSGRGVQMSAPDCEFVCFSISDSVFASCIGNLYYSVHTHLGKILSTKWRNLFSLWSISLCLQYISLSWCWFFWHYYKQWVFFWSVFAWRIFLHPFVSTAWVFVFEACVWLCFQLSVPVFLGMRLQNHWSSKRES